MKERTKFVAVLFGPGRRAGDMVAPGDADCRWRVAATLGRGTGVDDVSPPPEERAQGADADAAGGRN